MSMLRHWKILLGLLVVFLGGLVVGSVGTLRYVQKRYEERANPDNWGPRAMTWLRTDFQLTPEQEAQVRPSVDRAVGELMALRNNADQERRAILGRMLAEVAQHLTPTQREQLQTVLQEKERQRNAGSP